MLKIAGVVVLFNPPENSLRNIHSYFNQMDFLFIYDNSECENSIILGDIIKSHKTKYCFMEKNSGIATAINRAASYALENGFDFLLTMDQDTSVDPDFIESYKKFLSSNKFTQIGLLAPVPFYTEPGKITKTETGEIDAVITSGSLLNLRIFEKVGPFFEKLFIDYVDFEYCLRIRRFGFKIIQIKDAKIYHQLGNLEKHSFLFKTIYVTHHSPLRYYYRTRNRMYVGSKYLFSFPKFVMKDFFVFFNELVKIICFEKEKMKKIKMILLGLIDFISNRYGKFESIHS